MNKAMTFTLTPAAIDEVSLLCEKDLKEAGIDEKEIHHLRLAFEEILGAWLERLGGAKMKYKMVRKFYGNYVEIAVEGPRVDIQENDPDRQFLFVNKLIGHSGTAPVYSYGDGLNVLTVNLPKKIKKIDQTVQIFIAVAAAVICGYIGRMLPADVQSVVSYIAKVLFDRINALLAAISSFLVFFSVCYSISSIEDLSLFGRIGKRTVCTLLLVSFLSGALVVSIFCFFIPIEGLGAGGIYINLMNEIVNLLIDIVPPDVISPFLKGNIMQIVFLGVLFGFILLYCGDSAATVRSLTEESLKIVFDTINFLLKCMPILAFLSIFNLMFIKEPNSYAGIAVMFLLSIAAYHALLLIYFFASVICFRVKPKTLFKKLRQIYLMGFSTSTAMSGVMFILDNSGKIMGIKKSYSDFVNSMSYSVFMPQNVVSYIVYAIISAAIFNLPITVQFLITVLLLSLFLSMSPATVAMLPILFLQLGIPKEALAAAIAVSAVQRSFKMAVRVTCIMFGTLFSAGINGMLDKDVLRKDVDLSALD